ncbi:PREDICTED: O-acyltransferase WSD1-like [Ipomoea nil]|uniref:O-acyltransferase WSD1-like n=1 Tax=Ipomoea nil TaxID=35883 RepID=UPI000900BD1C|nr:PREDICTED: O-acyltransferase WSD1-like [Ipomoea nil]
MERNLKPIETRKQKSGMENNNMSIAEEPVSPSSRLLHEPAFNLHILAIMGFNSKINPHVFTHNMPHTLLKHPRFTSLMVVDKEENGKMKWVETEVDLSQHITVVEAPEVEVEGDETHRKNKKFVEDYVYELSKERMDMSRPLWDLHILNLKTRDAEALAVLRMHHALGDGASINSLLLACTRQTANPKLLPTISTRSSSPPKTLKPNNPKPKPKNFFKLVWNTLVDVFIFIATLFFLKDSQTPITPSPASESKPKRFAYRILSLNDFFSIKLATNTTINDVALGVTQAALSMYLNRRYGKRDIGSIEGQNNLPKNLRLRSCLFFNLRPAKGIQALADMMKKEKGESNSMSKWGWGNRFGYAILPLKIGMLNDPLDYVREAKATADRKKYSYEPIFTYYLANFVIKFFGPKAAAILTNKIFSNASTCFSNVVGPREDLEFFGHPIAFIAPTCYGQPSALMVHFQSYVDKMGVIISVDENVIPDPNQLLDDFEKSLHLIKDAAAAAATSSPTNL